MQPPDVVPSLGPPESPPRNSESAVFSLVLGLLSFFCLGPFAAIPAVVLGIIGNREIARSEGRVGGSAMSAAGIALGVFNLFACAALFVAVFASAAAPKPHGTATTTAPTFVPTFSPPTAGPRPTAAPGEEENGQITMMGEVVETQVGKVTLVDIPPVRSFVAELELQRQKAKAAHQKLVLFTFTQACRPCLSVAAVMTDPRMQDALSGVRLVRVSIHDADQELDDLGVDTNKIPGFYLLGPTLHAVDGINGGEWDDDTPENAAPVLGAFMRGTYKQRKSPFSPQPSRGTPRPPPTML